MDEFTPPFIEPALRRDYADGLTLLCRTEQPTDSKIAFLEQRKSAFLAHDRDSLTSCSLAIFFWLRFIGEN